MENNKNCNISQEMREKGMLCRGMFCEPCKKQRKLNNNQKMDYIDKLGYEHLPSTDGELWVKRGKIQFIWDKGDKIYHREDIDQYILGTFKKVELEIGPDNKLYAIEKYEKRVEISSMREYFLRFGPFKEESEIEENKGGSEYNKNG